MTRTDRGGRRDRILKAALEQALDGYDAVQMRAVAGSARVSASTVYQHFPSKDDLLLECFSHWLSTFEPGTALAEAGLADPHSQLMSVVGSLTDQMSSQPRFADTVARAYLHADGLAVGRAELVRDALIDLFADAMDASRTTGLRHHRHVAALVADVWLTNVQAIAQGRRTFPDLHQRLARTISIIAANAGTQPADRVEMLVLGA
ncbi:TetR family transcriptional regulator [Mycobacterium sp. ACS4331]|uniref:TetR/AcrR family transcriptional regulator n=1 Tax=Mycobacterium sp. ACS4331 TaxID=1834121 RepID=UPI0008022CBB|nr:TetR family transcriptional regulator [Mycobacterium sp. ACS4331]OBF13637.1 hypothetical protein A5727_16330 [Mycobacterium sp. ACS4331]